MTYPTYSQQQLQLKSIARLKQIYSEIGCTVEVNDKRCKDAWISVIADYQASKIQKVTLAAPDNQALAQAELDSYIAHQTQVVAPEPLRIVEISFDHHEYYAGNQLVASISHDDNHLTQRWVVMVNDKEIFRANTPMRCHRFICTHYKDGSLPVQEKEATPCTTGNKIMAQIFNECEKFGFEILNEGIYQNDEKLGEVGQTDGGWWFTRAADETQRVPCDSAMEAVQSLSIVDVSTDDKSIFDEYFLEQPLEQLTGDKLQRLLEKAELVTA
ncbi:hypothetical protein H6G97_44395 [Nostoc flagelliforme FACHB-838]|uniref:Uncharacterized protein n=1 Tax=Nostoc flagelliforme FACHB-838 TaxID=2692904 RepID=A0ABR8E4I0_9NOSO|nr:hypothetical protein [Nostoc flagelliforme]MBD2535991.1 hypothetical protein [Nostoc flagelliforme FACHB-838]